VVAKPAGYAIIHPYFERTPMKFMTFPQAMEIVSQFGYANKCESLLVAISDMEDNWDTLSLDEIAAYNVIISEYDMIAELA